MGHRHHRDRSGQPCPQSCQTWEVNLADLLRLEHLVFTIDVDSDFLARVEAVVLDVHLSNSLQVATGSFVWDPGRLLGVVRLSLALLPHMVLDLQPWRRVRIGTRGLLNVSGHCEGEGLMEPGLNRVRTPWPDSPC